MRQTRWKRNKDINRVDRDPKTNNIQLTEMARLLTERQQTEKEVEEIELMLNLVEDGGVANNGEIINKNWSINMERERCKNTQGGTVPITNSDKTSRVDFVRNQSGCTANVLENSARSGSRTNNTFE